MKIFKFYPRAYSRMYVVAESPDDVRAKADELFKMFVAQYIGGEEHLQFYDDEAMQEFRQDFDDGLQEIEEHDLAFVDNHY